MKNLCKKLGVDSDDMREDIVGSEKNVKKI